MSYKKLKEKIENIFWSFWKVCLIAIHWLFYFNFYVYMNWLLFLGPLRAD